MKRLLDVLLAAVGLLCLSPIIIPISLLIWLQDNHSPFYIGWRAGRAGQPFRMFKFRSMVWGADRSGVHSTAANDVRITRLGHFLRASKLDEIPQLWNVLKGEMSLVGPRPQVASEIEGYTEEEKRILAVTPGITDLSSIVFSDEGEILRGSDDADLAYEQLIRPWKSRLALLYVDRRSFVVDILLIGTTVIAIVRRPVALKVVESLLIRWHADPLLCRIVTRREPLCPALPPGADPSVSTRI